MLVKHKDYLKAAGELLASAVLDVFPNTSIIESYRTDLGYGLAFVISESIDQTALQLIEERMRILLKQKLRVEDISMMRENAAELFRHKGQSILARRALDSQENILSLTRIEDQYGLGTLSEAINTGKLGEVKLLSCVSDREKVEPLGECQVCRIEGILARDKKELKRFQKKFDSFRKLDHRILGQKMGLFDSSGEGGLTWLPNGEVLRSLLLSIWQDLNHQGGYRSIKNSAKDLSDLEARLWEVYRSGKLDMYGLPLRLAEICSFAPPQNWGKRGDSLHSLFSTRDFAYCLATERQAVDVLISSLQFIMKCINIFAIETRWYLVLNSQKAAVRQGTASQAASHLAQALNDCCCEYSEELRAEPGHSPRIEARFIDALGREWGGPSLTVSYRNGGGTGQGKASVLIVRSLFGSLERFIACLLERYEGCLPYWLAPEQVRIISINESCLDYARKIESRLAREGIRAGLDCSDAGLASRISAAEAANIPWTLVIGEKERRNGTISVRSHNSKGSQQATLDEFIESVQSTIVSPFAIFGNKLEK